MARLRFGRLTEAWRGEAADFTPLLAHQIDAVGAAISEFVIENQYGRADHDHLTRGLAYAVARRARGLVVVAEQHRDEFRAVAQYLNERAAAGVAAGSTRVSCGDRVMLRRPDAKAPSGRTDC